MPDPLISTYEFKVHGFDCGYGGPLRAFAMANFLQDAAGANAAEHGFGMGDLQARGQTWMLSRLELRVDEPPRDGETILVRTWPAGTRRLFAMRAIDIRRPGSGGALGESLVRAVYAYLVVDLAARRPIRPETALPGGIPCADEPLPVPDYAFDIPEAAEGVAAFSQRVRGRHIDHNGHANNAHLVNWLVDASAPEGSGPDELVLSALRVEFAAEALEGDELVALRAPLADSAYGAELAPVTAVAELRRGDAKVARALVGRRRQDGGER
jgi:medium-chain acyl-[acyl-carrier-protein] hydrolase